MKQYSKYYIKIVVSQLFKIFGGVYLIKFLFRKKPYYLVLNYHNFSKYNNYKIKRGDILETGYRDNFEKQVKFLKKHFTFLYPEEFFKGSPKKGINILITFDDGYKDNYDIAFPILKKHQASAVFFIVDSFIGTKQWLLHDKIRLLVSKNDLDGLIAEAELKKMNEGIELSKEFIANIEKLFQERVLSRNMMSWQEVRELSKNDFIIGSHTHSHRPLMFLKCEDKKREMELSISEIALQLKLPVTHFAYPNGLFTENCKSIMSEFKLEYIYTTNPGINLRNDSLFEIKRIGINASDSIGIILLKTINTINTIIK